MCVCVSIWFWFPLVLCENMPNGSDLFWYFTVSVCLSIFLVVYIYTHSRPVREEEGGKDFRFGSLVPFPRAFFSIYKSACISVSVNPFETKRAPDHSDWIDLCVSLPLVVFPFLLYNWYSRVCHFVSSEAIYTKCSRGECAKVDRMKVNDWALVYFVANNVELDRAQS